MIERMGDSRKVSSGLYYTYVCSVQFPYVMCALRCTGNGMVCIACLQVLIQSLSTLEVSSQLCCLRMDRLVLLCPLEQVLIRKGELTYDVLEAWPLRCHWMPVFSQFIVTKETFKYSRASHT